MHACGHFFKVRCFKWFLVVFSILFYFPGVASFVPSIGSFLVIDAHAQSTVAQVKRSVLPLNLSGPPNTESLMAAGQLGGQLYPTADEHPQKHRAFNQSFGRAIEEWNRHNYRHAVALFRQHVADYPDSPWVSEALLHCGCDAQYNGRYSEAEEHFNWIIENNSGKVHEGAMRLRTKAMQRLGTLKVTQNNLDVATNIFAHLKQESLDWRERTYASHWIQRISRYKSNKQAMLKCGTDALAYLLQKEGKQIEANEVASIAPVSDKGHSIGDLQDIATRYGQQLEGFQLSASDLSNIPLPAIMQIPGKSTEDRGHYWVLEKVATDRLELYDPQSGRRFTQSPEELSREWTGKTLLTATQDKQTTSFVKLSVKDLYGFSGGCCGVPAPEDGMGPPDGMGSPDDDPGDENPNSPKDPNNPKNPKDPCAEGSPIWNVNMISMNLFITDIPLWYDSPVGPSVKIRMSYNSQSAIMQNEPFGNKWVFNYGSYIVVDTSGNVTVFMPEGKRDVYTPDGQGGYIKPYGVFNTLTKIGTNHFELAFLNGTVYAYNIPSGTSSLQPFLVQIRDAYNQSLTFGYNTNVQLITITDALGKITNLTYNTQGLIQRIDDPFGRFVTFAYDAARNLTYVIDMASYWTQYTYDADVYLTSIQNPKGTWGFYIEPADGLTEGHTAYPPPGGVMWQDYRVTITDPLGGKEEYFYYGDPGYYSWYISPRDYHPYVSLLNNNFYIFDGDPVPKTGYQHDNSNPKPKIIQTYTPEGRGISYDYTNSTTGKPAGIYDSYANAKLYTYNDLGRITSFIDAKGSITSYTYNPNGIDVTQVRFNFASTPEDDNILLKSYTYNGNTHDVASITDGAGRVTTVSYNGYGQVQSVTEGQGTPLARTTQFTYSPTTHHLVSIQRGGSTLMSFTRDAIGRVRTKTDNNGLTLTYDYNNLNQVKKITYPDGRHQGIDYATSCPGILNGYTDRGGRTTAYTYDALKRLIGEQGPAGTISYEYDANSNPTKFRDPSNTPTSFDYDLDNALAKKTYADGKSIKYGYDFAGRLNYLESSRQYWRTFYDYDQNSNLCTVYYPDSSVLFLTYNDYNRIQTRTRSKETDYADQYDYYPDGRIKTIDGPWDNDTITFTYDALGRLKAMTPQGGSQVTYGYDTIGRLKTIKVGTITYTYAYTGTSTLPTTLARPNGSVIFPRLHGHTVKLPYSSSRNPEEIHSPMPNAS